MLVHLSWFLFLIPTCQVKLLLTFSPKLEVDVVWICVSYTAVSLSKLCIIIEFILNMDPVHQVAIALSPPRSI